MPQATYTAARDARVPFRRDANYPAFGRELARARARGGRPQTRNERMGRPSVPGLDDEVLILVTDRWRMAKLVRELDQAAVVIEPGAAYEWSFLRGWWPMAVTEGDFPELRAQLAAAGACWPIHRRDWQDYEAHLADLVARKRAREAKAA